MTAPSLPLELVNDIQRLLIHAFENQWTPKEIQLRIETALGSIKGVITPHPVSVFTHTRFLHGRGPYSKLISIDADNQRTKTVRVKSPSRRRNKQYFARHLKNRIDCKVDVLLSTPPAQAVVLNLTMTKG